jgi:hypothetical protein
VTVTDHLTLTQVRAYVRGALHPSTLVTIDDHLEGCAACRGALAREADASFGAEAFGRSLAAPEARPETPHLTFEHLRGAVDRTLGVVDAEWVDAHVGLCVMCAEELRDLEQFAAFVPVTTGTAAVRPAEHPAIAFDLASSVRRPVLPRGDDGIDEPPASFGVQPEVRMPWWLWAAAGVSGLALLQLWAC